MITRTPPVGEDTDYRLFGDTGVVVEWLVVVVGVAEQIAQGVVDRHPLGLGSVVVARYGSPAVVHPMGAGEHDDQAVVFPAPSGTVSP